MVTIDKIEVEVRVKARVGIRIKLKDENNPVKQITFPDQKVPKTVKSQEDFTKWFDTEVFPEVRKKTQIDLQLHQEVHVMFFAVNTERKSHLLVGGDVNGYYHKPETQETNYNSLQERVLQAVKNGDYQFPDQQPSSNVSRTKTDNQQNKRCSIM